MKMKERTRCHSESKSVFRKAKIVDEGTSDGKMRRRRKMNEDDDDEEL